MVEIYEIDTKALNSNFIPKGSTTVKMVMLKDYLEAVKKQPTIPLSKL